MKKSNCLFIFLLILLLIPSSVMADNVVTFTPRLVCSKSVKILNTTTCTINADISGGGLSNINAALCITKPGQSSCDSEAYSNFTNINNVGDGLTIGTISVPSANTAGNLIVNIAFTSATSSDGDVNITENNINETIKVLNNNATLSNLTIDSVSILDKISNKLTYDKDSVEIGAVTNDSSATVTGTGKISLKCGESTYNVIALAEDKTTKKTYPITIVRNCSSDATLKSIKLSSGVLTPTFSSLINSYSLNVSKDIDNITITPIATNEKATVKVMKDTKTEFTLDYGTNDITIEVTAENGTKKNYTVTINREDGRSSSNYLSNIELSNGKLLFDKEKTNYEVKVLYSVMNIDINATAEASSSKIEIIGGKDLVVGDNTIIIKVTSETGAVKEYTLLVKRLQESETLGDNPNIKNIIIEGYNLDFKSNLMTYTLKIDKEKQLNIEVEMEDTTSTYEIVNNENLKNKSIIRINTISADGTTNTYKIVIEKKNTIFIILVAVFAVSVAGGLIFLVLKNKNKNAKVKTRIVKDDKLLSRVDKQLNEIEKGKDVSSSNNVSNTITEEYKICSLCGHRILSNIEVCPYCKKKF